MAMMFQTLERVMGPTDALRATCACGHEKVWPWRAAFRAFSPGATPLDVRRRLTCVPCRAAGRPRTDPAIDIERWTPPRG
jgi:hypothetical protein